MNADCASVVGMAAKRIATVERPRKSFMIAGSGVGEEKTGGRGDSRFQVGCSSSGDLVGSL